MSHRIGANELWLTEALYFQRSGGLHIKCSCTPRFHAPRPISIPIPKLRIPHHCLYPLPDTTHHLLPFPLAFPSSTFSFTISFSASFLLHNSNTSSVVTVLLPACFAKLSKSCATDSVCAQTISVRAPMNWGVAFTLKERVVESTRWPMESQRVAFRRYEER